MTQSRVRLRRDCEAPVGNKVWAISAVALLGLLIYSGFGPLNMHGLKCGMTKSEVRRRLGEPVPGEGMWVYYFGFLAAGAEFLGIEFASDGRVKALHGEQVCRGWRPVAGVGDTEEAVVREFGPVARRKVDGRIVTCRFEHLEVTLVENKVFGITLVPE